MDCQARGGPPGISTWGAGRRQQIDFVGIKQAGGGIEGNWAFALETKIFVQNVWQPTLLDLLRLNLLSITERNLAPRLFLGVAKIGPGGLATLRDAQPPVLTQPVYRYLLKHEAKPPIDFFEEILPWPKDAADNRESKVVDFRKIEPRFLRWAAEFQRAVRERIGDYKLPGRVQIELVGKNWSKDYLCGLWRIRNVQGVGGVNAEEMMATYNTEPRDPEGQKQDEALKDETFHDEIDVIQSATESRDDGQDR